MINNFSTYVCIIYKSFRDFMQNYMITKSNFFMKSHGDAYTSSLSQISVEDRIGSHGCTREIIKTIGYCIIMLFS